MRTVYLDLETTGLNRAHDEIIEIGLLADSGAVLLDSLVQPARLTAWPEAEQINGIAPAAVTDAPRLAELRPRLIEAIAGARVVIYNASFDSGFLGSDLLSGAGEVVCAMLAFARAFGVWDDRRDTWRWQRLAKAAAHVGYVWPGNAHRAIHDCMATRAVWHWTIAQATPTQTMSTAPHVQQPER
ncbi:3'-5' exonuclease [Thiocapsa rosea]|uniref:DNA polymerase-3 subunit epsilon n=1 Tax=Thiocapsa rosea TaxID=69360 RepID=A0A495UNR9_9GAMM|nr:3'-5' exonuclease [Thiocapsa rosea]RKT37953.1 DNA polymerase-3 subunit epsilon [Thiocapsa rosea]